MHDSPQSHPRISIEERDHIVSAIERERGLSLSVASQVYNTNTTMVIIPLRNIVVSGTSTAAFTDNDVACCVGNYSFHTLL